MFLGNGDETINNSPRRRVKNMDKASLQGFLSEVSIGDKISVRWAEVSAPIIVTVTSTQRGRGRGGPVTVGFAEQDLRTNISASSPEQVVFISRRRGDGSVCVIDDLDTVRRIESEEVMAAKLYTLGNSLYALPDHGAGTLLEIEMAEATSSETVERVLRVVNVCKARGRLRQYVLTLADGPDDTCIIRTTTDASKVARAELHSYSVGVSEEVGEE